MGIMTSPDGRFEVETFDCPDCRGFGHYIVGNGLPGKLHDNMRIRCNECNGTGAIILTVVDKDV